MLTDLGACVSQPATSRHKWHEVMCAYLSGQTVQYRNTGCNERPTGAWYDLTDAMVEGRGWWACQTGAFGQVWDWAWMEFQVKPELH